MRNKRKPVEIATRERLYITEFLNDPSLPDVSVARARVEPGVTTERHALSVLEWYVVESGSGLLRLGGRDAFTIGPGDAVEIAAGRAQQVTNTGDADLLFLCVCVPRFTPDTYTPLE